MGSRRWAAASGFAFAGLFVAAILTLGEQLGSAGDADRHFEAYFSETSNRVRDIVGAYVLVAAGLAFVAFIANLFALLPDRARGAPALIALGTSFVFAALLLAAAAALSSVATSLAYASMFDEDPHEFGPDAARLATQFGFMLIVFAMCAAAACIAATSLAGRSVGVPVWFVAFGLVAALALLLSFFFMPMIALPVWVVVVSAWLVRPGRQVTQEA